MPHFSIPPPSVESLIGYCVEWLARNLRAKVTVTVWHSESKHYTEEYDARFLKVGAGRTAQKTPNAELTGAARQGKEQEK